MDITYEEILNHTDLNGFEPHQVVGIQKSRSLINSKTMIK